MIGSRYEWTQGLVQVERDSGYGSVPGLDDEELANPEELERQVFMQEWGPILALPDRRRHSGIRPVMDEFGQWDWGAFGTVDFDRIRPAFNKARYKREKLQEELRDARIMMDIVRDRLSPAAREGVRRAVQLGSDLDDFTEEDEHIYAKYYLRARRICREIHRLKRGRRQGFEATGPARGRSG